jgi:hypothetical protein
MIGLSHIALAGALAAAVTGFAGYLHGIGVGKNSERAVQFRVEMAAEAEREKLQSQIDAAAEKQQAAEYGRQTNVREIVRESQKIIERPVYRTVCVDADGVRLLDAAADVANGTGLPAFAGAPAGAAAAAANGGGRDDGRAVPAGDGVAL